jgi:hypothetical protein
MSLLNRQKSNRRTALKAAHATSYLQVLRAAPIAFLKAHLNLSLTAVLRGPDGQCRYTMGKYLGS